MSKSRTVRMAAAALLGLGSLGVFAGTAQAEPIDYVKIELLELTCHQNSEGNHDEAYLNITDANGNQVKVWPGGGLSYQTMGAGYVRSLTDGNGNSALILGREQARTLTLWDKDTFGSDKLGSTLVTGSEVGAEVQYRSLEGSGGVYTIAYRVIDI
ncbi:hypothetical protein ABZV60_11130 [Streptomyces sp. NPDC004787]|uniref:hypothetical protein n=1 Tax=Streptomyces sp. NPDC004787 TaxID=3154291 RepID=UPI0033A54466